MPEKTDSSGSSKLADLYGSTLYAGRWLLSPVYLGLMVALFLYSLRCVFEVVDMVRNFAHVSEPELMVTILNLLDISMVGNLVVMVAIGGYSIFLRRLHLSHRTDKPQWLDHIDSTALKVKMGLSLIGVSSVYLLKAFVQADSVSNTTLTKMIVIHMVFVVSTVAIAFTSFIMNKTHIYNKDHDQPSPSTSSSDTADAHGEHNDPDTQGTHNDVPGARE